MKKSSFYKNHSGFEKWIDWYGNFLDRHFYHLYTFSKAEEYELLESVTLKIAARWEALVIQDVITSLNRDSSRYSSEIGLKLKKHLTKDEAEAIIIGHRFIDFKGIGDIKHFAKKHLSSKYNPFKSIDSNISKKIDQFFTMRNYLAHYSKYSKRKYKAMLSKDFKLKRLYEPGKFLSKVDKSTKSYRWADFINTFLQVSRSMQKI